MNVRTLLLVLFAGGCGSTEPSRFYLLSPVETGVQEGAATLDVAVDIASVELPRYLATPTIVTRASANELELAEYDRWAEPLEESFARCLAENLAAQIPTRNVSRAPWERVGTPDCVLRVAVDRFDVEDGRVLLEVHWSLTYPERANHDMVERSAFEAPLENEGFAAIARAMSRALAEFSGTVAQSIRSRTGP